MISSTEAPAEERRGIRWWPAGLIAAVTLGALVWIRTRDQLPFQQRNLQSLSTLVIGLALLLIWWAAFSRARWKLRIGMLALFVATSGGIAGMFRITGVDGDLVPILKPRWARRPTLNTELTGPPDAAATNTATTTPNAVAAPLASGSARPDFPQFLGPDRTAMLAGPALDPDWKANPPRLIWKQPIGAAWSGFAIVNDRALTQEQRGDEELVTCYDLTTGRLLWSHADAAHYQTTIAGEGPRCTPTVASNRVYTLGATGLLNRLDLASGRALWRRNITQDAGSRMPQWGFSGSPLLLNGRVHVGAGGKPDRSMIAYDAATGEIVWRKGSSSISHASPFFATLAGRPQILMANSSRITAHDAADGQVLWEYPWGVGQPHVAAPIVVGTNRVVYSSGYGVGSELLEITPGTTNALAARRIWKSNRMKAKFSNLVARDGFVYGLDDGMMACLDLKDGSMPWKEGRYGHGQGLLVGDLFLLMAENGELVLLRPSPTGPNELGRFPVFTDKTWNPIALSGPLLLVRNDREAACLRLAVRTP